MAALVALLALIGLMSHAGYLRGTVLLGGALVLLMAVGLLVAIRDRTQPEAGLIVSTTSARDLVVPATGLFLALAVWVVSVRAAVAGVLPAPRVSAGVLITASFIAAVFAGGHLAQRLGVLTPETPLVKRRGLWVVLVTTLVQLPLLGSFSLIDPWETHYGEVAREMLARADWISLWWAQDGWFWSKPVLNFWLQGLSFSLFGVPFAPDAMLRGAGSGLVPQPEWAVRIPGFLMTLGAAYALYKAAALVWGRRAAWLGAVVLATTPYWVLLARQSMADMAYVAPLSAAMALILVACATPAHRVLARHEMRWRGARVTWTAMDILMGIVLALVGVQVAYLLSRHVTLDPHGGGELLRLHPDEFFAGSGMGNCGIAGNRECTRHSPTLLHWQPYKTAALWVTVCAFWVWRVRRERHVRRVAFLGAWVFVALSVMAKGAPGFVLPPFVLVALVIATGRWRLLMDARVLSATLVVSCVALPWFVQAYARHGAGFIDRLVFHDMYKRAFVHVHDTNTGDDVSFGYYLWQLGYGLFPWSGLCVGGLLWWLRSERTGGLRSRYSAALFGLWFVAAFAMFSISLTKFHHYILPAVPPLAVLTGVLLDRFLGTPKALSPGRFAFHSAALVASVGAVWIGVALWMAAHSSSAPGPLGLRAFVAAGLFSIAALTSYPLLRGRIAPQTDGAEHQRGSETLAAVVSLLSVILLGLIGRDLLVDYSDEALGQIRLLHLFTYNYSRAWPQSLSLHSELVAFASVSLLTSLLLLSRQMRRWGVHAMLVMALLWATWVADVYLVKLAPHWGQRGIIMTYYSLREGPAEPLVAYQMNWKGENFYTGNRLPVFVSSGEEFRAWVKSERARGTGVFYFVTEHSRTASLRSELDNPEQFALMTNSASNNKFVLVRVEFASA